MRKNPKQNQNTTDDACRVICVAEHAETLEGMVVYTYAIDSEKIERIRFQYDIMQSFAYDVPIVFRENLLNALECKGAFRRFKEALRRRKLLDEWHSYKTAAYRKEAREWCDFKGIKWSADYKPPMK